MGLANPGAYGSPSRIRTATITLSADGTGADGAIVGSTDGTLGYATRAGCTVVAAPGANKRIVFLGGYIDYTYSTAAYTGGGSGVGFIYGDQTQTVTAAQTGVFTAAASRFQWFVPANGTATVTPVNKALNIWASTAFTQPGTAAGTATVYVEYLIEDVP